MKSDYKARFIITNGKRRRIVTYSNDEKRNEHIDIKNFLEENLLFSKFTKAYIANSSIYKNAQAHMYNDIFIKYDIEKFFDNINHKILVEILHEQLNLRHEIEKYSILEVSDLVSNCIFGKRGLPLGLITSPILANIYLKTFDNIFYGKLKKMNLKNVIYTRYADDLTISFKNPENFDVSNFDDRLTYIEEVLVKQLKRYKLKVNYKKHSIINLKKSNHVRITGISIIKTKNGARQLSVGKKKINKLYDDAFELYVKKQTPGYILTEDDHYNISRVKGMESFILSIHKKGYNQIFPEMMQEKLKKVGFETLNELIRNL